MSLDSRRHRCGTARRSTGLDDFGGDSWRPHFDVLRRALRHRGPPHRWPAGSSARTELLRALRQRLLLAAAWADRPDDPRRADRRAGVRRRHRPVGHVDPARAARPRSRPAGRRRTWELLHPGEAVGGRRRRRPGALGHDVHAFWADLQPAYESMHHNDGDEPNECIFATMLEFLSDQWGGTYEVPTYSAHLVGADHTDAYRYHREVLQTLQRRRTRRPMGAQGAEPPRASSARCSRSTPTPGSCRSTATR